MTDQEQIKAIAKLEKWYVVQNEDGLWGLHNKEKCVNCYGWETEEGAWGALSRYGYDKMLTSRDAIIPVILKQSIEIQKKVINRLYSSVASFEGFGLRVLESTPQQLCEVLLRATGKWKD